MILVFNVKITDIRLIQYQRGEHYPPGSRMDIFKYCIASYAAMLPLISKAFFYVTTEGFSEREKELEEYIYTLFPKEKVHLEWRRNDKSSDWVKSYEQIDAVGDDIIWIACNDDHIFIDKNLEIVESAIEALTKDPDPMAIFYYSHWPEIIRVAHALGGHPIGDGNLVRFLNWGSYDSIEIIKKERFKRYWFEKDHGDATLFKTDSLCVVRPQIIAPTYAPTREIVRHYDGYSHVADMRNITPPLIIPPGFFEDSINIKYGFYERHIDCVNLNPMHPLLYAFDPDGTDYRWHIDDLPLFWKNKIKTIEERQVQSTTAALMRAARNSNIFGAANVGMVSFGFNFHGAPGPPVEWFKKHFI